LIHPGSLFVDQYSQCHVLQRIGQYLKYGSAYHPPSPAALIPLMCCSKRFLNIFAEVLYRDVSLTQLDHLDAYSTYVSLGMGA
jgi:hypothetical protein